MHRLENFEQILRFFVVVEQILRILLFIENFEQKLKCIEHILNRYLDTYFVLKRYFVLRDNENFFFFYIYFFNSYFRTILGLSLTDFFFIGNF